MSQASDTDPRLREAAQQARAEAADGPAEPGADAGVAAYRFVYHVARTAPLPEPPPSFALTMARLAADFGEEAGVEIWLLRLLATAAVAALAFSAAWLAGSVDWMGLPFPRLPWRLLATIALGGGLLGLADRLLGRRVRGAGASGH